MPVATQAIVDRVKKLLALSQSSNEHEAAVANEKAHVMMLEYSIDRNTLGLKSNDAEEDFIVDNEIVTDSLPWRRRIGNAIASMYFCGYLYMFESEGEPGKPGYRRFDRHMFTGDPSNVAIVKIMFTYLTEAVDRGCDVSSRGVKVNERGKFRVSFKTAAAEQLSVRIYKRIIQANEGKLPASDGKSNLPALASMYAIAAKKNRERIEQFASDQEANLKTARSVINPSHQGGVEAGRKLGDALGLDQQVTTNKTELLR